jgi:hypothetical protein
VFFFRWKKEKGRAIIDPAWGWRVLFGGTGFQPVLAQAKACGYKNFS